MRIIGIDPGMAIVGYSIVDIKKNENVLVASGSIQTSSKDCDACRLFEISQDLATLVEKYSPDAASVEKLFFFKNAKTIIPVAEARGVILMTLAKYEVPVHEYTPMVVKQVMTGYGRASKDEVAKMVEMCISCASLPKLDDTVDSIAIALCHARSAMLV